MRSVSKEQLTTAGGLSILAAFLCFTTAVIFGCVTTVQIGNGPNEAPNVTAAGASCGFGVASGLCLIAAAIAESGARRREPRVTPPGNSDPAPTGPA
jgi:hypothetical protein